MGANQSGQQTATTENNQHGILVVNPNPGQKSEGEIVLPPRVPPILPIEGQAISPPKHGKEFQLDHQLWIDFVRSINEFANSRADLIATRQSQLQEKIVLLDDHVQKFTDSYVNDTHKALARMNDDCRRVEEVNKLLHKCTIQSEICVDMLNKLNVFLPQDHKLETLES